MTSQKITSVQFRVLPLVAAFLAFWTTGCNKENNEVAKLDTTYEAVEYLKVSSDFCDVEVIGEDRADIAFSGHMQGSFEPGKYTFQEQVKDDRMKVWIEEPLATWGQIRGKMTFRVPKGTRVKVTTSSGDIYVSGLNGEKAKLRTNSGDVLVEDIATYVNAKSASGDIKVNRLQGKLKAGSTSGDHHLITVEGTVTIEATSGDVTMNGVTGVLSLQTTSGDIRGEMIAPTASSHIETTSGDVRMRLKEHLETYGFQLKSRNGSLSVGEALSREAFSQESEGVMITGVTTSGDQSYNN